MTGPIRSGIPHLRYSSAVNIVFDGNSLVAGNVMASPSTQSVPAQLKQLDPLNGTVTVTNTGVGGQNIANMRSRRAVAVDANYVANKKNVLIAWEGTNSICNTSMTGAAAAADMAAYCAEVRAVHLDWIIVLMTTLPRFDVSASTWSIAQANAELTAYDTYLKNNFRSMGAKAVVDVRAAGVFVYTGVSMSAGMSPYMIENVHYNPAGGALISGYVASGLKRLPSR